MVDPNQSLNAGSELDDENVLFEQPIVPGEIPDLNEEINIVTVLEGRIDDLNYLLKDIVKNSGMSKQFALEAERILPGFGNVPIGFYTEHPSATRYKVALEEISHGVWALIAAATAAIIALIVKVISWISGKKKSDKVSDGVAGVQAVKHGLETTENALKAVESVPTELNQAMQQNSVVIKDAAGHEVKYSSMDQIFNDRLLDDEKFGRAKKIMNSEDPLFHDIINHGEYSKTMQDLGNMMRPINAALKSKLQVMDEIIRNDMSGSAETNAVNKKIDMMNLKKQEGPTMVKFHGREMTLQELSRYVSDVRQRASEKKTHKPITFTQLYSSMLAAVHNSNVKHMLIDMEDTVGIMGDMKARLNKMEDIARDLATDGIPGAVSEDVGPMIRTILGVIGQDISGFGQLSFQVEAYVKQFERMANDAIGFGKEIIARASEEIREGGGEPPTAWKSILTRLKEQSQAIVMATYRR